MASAADLSNSEEWRRVLRAIASVNKDWRTRYHDIAVIRPGFRRVNGVATTQKAIVVEAVPTGVGGHLPQVLGEVDGIPVDVVPVDPLSQRSAENSFVAWSRAHGAAKLGDVEFSTAEATANQAPHIGYTPPPDTPLEPMQVRDILCHVGPDSGWSTLKEFLAGTHRRLSVSMYDLTAEHVVEQLVHLASNEHLSLELILDEKADEAESLDALRAAWGERLVYTPALVHGANRLFANAYHTKIAVRDGSGLWQSSGNWSPNSQPVVPDAEPSPYKRGNREWHVVINHPPLAALLETYVKWDRERAAAAAVAELAPSMPDLLIPESVFMEFEAAVVQPHRFKPKHFATHAGSAIHLEPLMTPDNYGARILGLIESAHHQLFMQYSYVRQPAYPGVLEKLVKAVAHKMADPAVDVRVIVDGRNQLPAHTDFLIGIGWDPGKFRKQTSRVHNKGILVDDRFTAVGSQNWSSDGVEFNRDATLLFDSPDIANYYREVFMFDWENLTKSVQTTEITPVVARAAKPTPRGFVRVPWSTWYGD